MSNQDASFGFNIDSSGADRAAASLDRMTASARNAAGGVRDAESASDRMNRQLQQMIALQQQMTAAMQQSARASQDAADAAQRHHRHMIELGVAAGALYVSYKAVHGVVSEISNEIQRSASAASALVQILGRIASSAPARLQSSGFLPSITTQPTAPYLDLQNASLAGGVPVSTLLGGRALGAGFGQGTPVGPDADRLVASMTSNFRDLSENGRLARQTLADYGVTAHDATEATRQFLVALAGVQDGLSKLQAFQTVFPGASTNLMRPDIAASMMAVTPQQQYRQQQLQGIAAADAASMAVRRAREMAEARATRNWFGIGTREPEDFSWDLTGQLGPIYRWEQEAGQIFTPGSQYRHRAGAFSAEMGRGLSQVWSGNIWGGLGAFFGGYGGMTGDLLAQLGIGSHPNLPSVSNQPKAALSEQQREQATQLLRMVDPSMRAGVYLEKLGPRLETALQQGVINQEEYNQAVKGLAARFYRLNDPVGALADRLEQSSQAMRNAPLTAAGQAEAEVLFQERLNPYTGELRDVNPQQRSRFHQAFILQGQRTQAVSNESLSRQVQELEALTRVTRDGAGAMNEVRAAFQVQEDALKNNSTAQQQQYEKTLLLTQAFQELAQKAAEVARHYEIEAQNAGALAEAARGGPLAVRRLRTEQGVSEQFRPAREAAQGLPGNWEMQHNNFAGMRIPGVYGSPGQGGFQSFATPEQGIAHIERQLLLYQDRDKLTTLSGIINKWAPASDHNPTPTLIKRAAGWTGFGADQPLNLHDPMVMTAVTEAMIRNEQGGKTLAQLGLSREQIQGISNVTASGSPASPSASSLVSGMQSSSTANALSRLGSEALQSERLRQYESGYRRGYTFGGLPAAAVPYAIGARGARESGQISDSDTSQRAEMQRQLSEAALQEYTTLRGQNDALQEQLKLQQALAEAAAQGAAAEKELQDQIRITTQFREAETKARAAGDTQALQAIDAEKTRALGTAATQRSLAGTAAIGRLGYSQGIRLGNLSSEFGAMRSGGEGAYAVQQIVNQEVEQLRAQGVSLQQINEHLNQIEGYAAKQVEMQQKIEDERAARSQLASTVNGLVDTTEHGAMGMLFPEGRTSIERKISRIEAFRSMGMSFISAGVNTFALDPLKQTLDSAITGKPNTGINAGSVAGGLLGNLFGLGGGSSSTSGAMNNLTTAANNAAAALNRIGGTGLPGVGGLPTGSGVGGGGIGGFFSNMIGGGNSLIGRWLGLGGGGGVSGPLGPSAAGFSLPFMSFPGAHSGWLVGDTPAPQAIFAYPGIFAHAPRLHSGLAPDEFPAILQRGERVLSRGQVAAGQSGPGSTFIHAPVNVYTPDVNSFRATASQVGAAQQRQIQNGQRYS